MSSSVCAAERAWAQRRGLLLAAAGLGLGLAGCSRGPSFHAIDVTGSGIGGDFRLADPDGRLRSLADFRGQVVLVFFGFTQCPDVCPTALARALQLHQLLGEQAGRLQVVFVTVDPERDTPALLREYMQAFHPSFLGLRGSLAETESTAAAFKVQYRKVPTGSSYTMDHTALSYVFDPQGRLRLAVRHEMPAEQLAQDLRQLLNGQ